MSVKACKSPLKNASFSAMSHCLSSDDVDTYQDKFHPVRTMSFESVLNFMFPAQFLLISDFSVTAFCSWLFVSSLHHRL